jgi:hypothetical protein
MDFVTDVALECLEEVLPSKKWHNNLTLKLINVLLTLLTQHIPPLPSFFYKKRNSLKNLSS